VFTQSEIKISWPAALQKPGYVNASALVGITICRVKAKKIAWYHPLQMNRESQRFRCIKPPLHNVK